MGGTAVPGGRQMRRGLVMLAAVGILAVALPAAALLGTFAGVASKPSGSPASVATELAAEPSLTPVIPPAPTAAPATPTAVPSPTPIPLVPAPLTGRLVTAAEANQHPIAVMIDDHTAARPQAGFNAASIVWHAPAEGGVPRYMLIFQDRIPTSVGPIRSTRQYYVEWAAETRSMLVHHGGSPEAQRTLARYGDGEWVFNADGMRWEPRYVWRVHDGGRLAPHNVFSDGEHLRQLAAHIHAVDGPLEPVWQFAPEPPYGERAAAGTIRVVYPYETITYRYDPFGNRYLRYINGSKTPQKDAADGGWVAPRNVVILRMYFAAIIGDTKQRLEAGNVGKGEAWISTNGRTIKGTWRKVSPAAPTLLYGPDGEEITLSIGQTFVQVIARSYDFEIDDGLPQGVVTTHPTPAP